MRMRTKLCVAQNIKKRQRKREIFKRLGKVRILGTMKKFPAGVMVIPLLIGCIINTFFPDILTIGGFTTGLFKGGIQTLIGLFLFCSGATIDVKMAGRTVYVGVVLTALKFFLGFGLASC